MPKPIRFDREFIPMILLKQKTQTIRRARHDIGIGPSEAAPDVVHVIEGGIRIRYSVGQVREFGPDWGRVVGLIRIDRITESHLHKITPEQALLDGFKTQAALLRYWQNRFGSTTDLRARVWVIRFTLLEPGYETKQDHAYRTF